MITSIKNINNLNYDKKFLELYINRENSPKRINLFEKLLCSENNNNDDDNDDINKKIFNKIINYYFNKNNDDNYDDIEEIKENIFYKNYYDLCKKYMHYENYLFFDCKLHTFKKFFLNLILFMDDNTYITKKREDIFNKKNDNILLMISIIIKLWCQINMNIEILKTKFIPLAFSKWYKNYPFYNDYFILLTNNNIDIKNDFYTTFYISNNNEEERYNKTIVNNSIETILKKHSHKLFYEFIV